MSKDEIKDLVFHDRSLKALKLAEKHGYTKLAKKIRYKLGHYFHEQRYLDKYANGPMDFRPDVNYLFNAPWMYNRYGILLEHLANDHVRSFIDMGCYEGALVFTAIQTYGIDAYGVELNKEAVIHNNEVAHENGLGVRFFQSRIEDFEANRKYDAVSCNEVLEHVVDPKALLLKLKSLSDGWIYVSTPDGCYDPEATKNVWNTKGAMFDHLWAFTRKDIEEMLNGYKVEFIPNNDRLLIFRYK